MLKTFHIITAAALALAITSAAPAYAHDFGEPFIVLPSTASGPEGITIGPDNNLYISTFGFKATGPVAAPGKVYVYTQQGGLVRTLSVTGSTANLLGLAFHPTTKELLVIDTGGGKVLKVNKSTGAATTFMTVTGASSLNAMTFDKNGNVYVSDSAQGIIWKTGAAGGAGTAWVTSPLLQTAGVPPFGANGLDFTKNQGAMYVANSGNDQIIRIPVGAGGVAGAPVIFVNSINGADGLFLDDDDNFWVAANQGDNILVLDKTGKLIDRFGRFEGVDKNGVPKGLLFPASMVLGPRTHGHHHLFVTNLALDLRLFGLAQTPDSQWTAKVKRYTISRIHLDWMP
jgi:sugar lactone lactonase YvrE